MRTQDGGTKFRIRSYIARNFVISMQITGHTHHSYNCKMYDGKYNRIDDIVMSTEVLS
jgi:hypothetical protein